MKKTYKVISIISIVLMIVLMCSNVFAAISISSINSSESMSGADSAMIKIGSSVFTVVTNAGIILAVVVLAILGVKYMMGSPEEKSEYKKSMMPYFVGAVLVFAASTIAKFVVSFGQSI